MVNGGKNRKVASSKPFAAAGKVNHSLNEIVN